MFNKFFTETKLKYIKNTFWMLLEKLIRMPFILLINIVLARYLGVNEFGYLSYSLALLSIVAIFTHLGLGGIVVKELKNNKYDEAIVLGTVFYIKMIGAVIGFIVLVCVNLYTESLFSLHFYLLFIISLIIFIKPFYTLEIWFISQVKAKYISISSLLSLIISSILKILFIINALNIVWIASTYFIESFLIILLLLFFYNKYSYYNFHKWKFSLKLAKELLSKSWMIMIGSFFALVYLKSDQIMLKWLYNTSSVGIYSVASSLSEVWYVLPAIIVNSFFPKFVEYRQQNIKYYYQMLQKLMNLLFLIALLIAIIVSLISTKVIILLYGNDYKSAGVILSIHIWAALFIFMREVFSKWIIIENLIYFSIITHGLGMVFNIILNFIFIPKYGAYGAAIATLISYSISSYFSLFFFKDTRKIFYMMNNAIIFPIIYLRKRII